MSELINVSLCELPHADHIAARITVNMITKLPQIMGCENVCLYIFTMGLPPWPSS